MACSDSMFLIEMMIEELKSYITCKEFYIQSQFSDVFLINLKDPNDSDPLVPNTAKKLKIKSKDRRVIPKKAPTENKIQVGQSILFTSSIESLITAMKNFPIELTLFDKEEPETILGSTHIPWSPVYIDYLHGLNTKVKSNSAHVSGTHNIYDEFTLTRMATMIINIKLTHLKDKLLSLPSLSEGIHTTYMQPGLNYKPKTVLSTIQEVPYNVSKEKCTTDNNKKPINYMNMYKSNKKKGKRQIGIKNKNNEQPPEIREENLDPKWKLKSSIINQVKSETDLSRNKRIEIIKTKSCASINRKYLNIVNYIFGDSEAIPLRNQVLCVGYFTVENDFNKDASSSKDSSIKKQDSRTPDSKSRTDSKEGYKFRICDKDCPSGNNDSECSIDLPADAANLITVTKCNQLKCDNKIHREAPPVADDMTQLDVTNYKNKCCDVTETVEKVVGKVQANMKFERNDCLCSCECTFGMVRHTTYCETCGGFERLGDDSQRNLAKTHHPCPIYHKLPEKKESGSDKSLKKGKKSPGSGKSQPDSESGKSKRSKKKKDERFKFKYGFKGIPAKIGHSKCFTTCVGTLNPVPKHMGWLWNAEDVPGIKCRPMYKPGAVNKHVLHLLKIAKNPDTILKKRRRESGKAKRSLKRPLLTVTKKDGEYIVTMETMKVFSKPRAPNQHPYEDKPLVTYTIGRTEEENKDRQKKKEREKRRLERDQRTFIQSAFTDMCKEICLKTYQQALGILPDAEDPDCICYPKHPGPENINLDHSCSCSEDTTQIGSDTDSDEWIVEFTPPNAKFDPKYQVKKLLKVDNSSQYTYLDYRVKLLDRYGNQVPRFFKGPDGSTLCSDLGGFWSPDHKWLEINNDGYIGPDERWAPLHFIGPNGENVECDSGKFQTSDGSWLVVGVDGYIGSNGKWKFYQKPKGSSPRRKKYADMGKKGAGDKKGDKYNMSSDFTWSCFGDASPRDISKLGIFGHGQDKKLLIQYLKEMLARGEIVTIPEPGTVPRVPASKRRKYPQTTPQVVQTNHSYDTDSQWCKHPAPSGKGVVSIDRYGRKTYFKLDDYKNRRPKERICQLTNQGKSLSSFHEPCFGSFINHEMMKRQLYEKFLKLKPCEHSADTKCVSTQYKYRYAI